MIDLNKAGKQRAVYQPKAETNSDTLIDLLKGRLPSIASSCSGLKKESKDSHCGPCLKCGGTDRLVVKDTSSGEKAWCRQCHENAMDKIDFQKWLTGKSFSDLAKEYVPEQSGSNIPFSRPAFVPTIPPRDVEEGKLLSDEHLKAIEKSKQLWEKAKTPDPNHPYLLTKKIRSTGLKQLENALIVPMQDIFGNHMGHQKIYPPKPGKKNKFYNNGSKIDGIFFIIGNLDSIDVVYFVEGLATGWTVHLATGKPTIVSFDSGNLPKVARIFKKRYPEKKYVIAADNDLSKEKEGKGNPGKKKGEEAAKAIDAHFCLCPFDTDFNDLCTAHGMNAVKNALKNCQKISNHNKPEATILQIDNEKVLQKAKEILTNREPCGPFDLKLLPKSISDYIIALSAETAAEPVMLLQSVLCSISAIMGKHYCIPEGEYFQRLYGNIWILSTAESGAFKTTALNKGAASCFLIRETLQKQIHTIQTKGENLSNDDSERIIKLERQIPLLPSRATAEGLLELLAQGCGGQIVCSEFGEWLENLSKSFAGALKSTLTAFFDVPSFYDYKTRTQSHLKIEEPYITINAVSTLDWVIRRLEPDDVSSGFFARFLIFDPPEKKIIPSALPIIKHKSPVITEFVDMLKAMSKSLGQHAYKIEYALPDETRQLFEAYHQGLYGGLYSEPEGAQEILGPYVKRWSPYLLKIAMILQFINDPDSNVIQPQILEYSKGIIDYAVKSTTHLFKTELGETEHQRKCRKIIEYIARHDGKRTWGQLLHSHLLDGGSKDYEYPCQTLEESGRINFERSANLKRDHLLILNVGS